MEGVFEVLNSKRVALKKHENQIMLESKLEAFFNWFSPHFGMRFSALGAYLNAPETLCISMRKEGRAQSQKTGLKTLFRMHDQLNPSAPQRPATFVLSSKPKVQETSLQKQLSASTLFYTVAFVEGAAVMVREKLLGMLGAEKEGQRIDLKITNTTTTTC